MGGGGLLLCSTEALDLTNLPLLGKSLDQILSFSKLNELFLVVILMALQEETRDIFCRMSDPPKDLVICLNQQILEGQILPGEVDPPLGPRVP